MTWLLLSGAIVSEVAATLSLRLSEGLRRRAWVVPVVAGYALAFVLLWRTLATGLPVGVAYGVWAAVGVALTALAGRVLFRDPLTPRMLVGLVAITVGVLLIELGAH